MRGSRIRRSARPARPAVAGPVATTLLVFGHARPADSAARVRAAVDYVTAHRAAFAAASGCGRVPRVVFTGGWAGASAGAAEPPPGCREADHMLELARAAGLDRHADLRSECRSRSTLENLAHTLADGLLA